MFAVRKIAITVLFTASTTIPFPAQQTNNANDILKKVGETYVALNSLQVEGVTVIQVAGTNMQSKVDLPFKGAFVPPAKMRIETNTPGVGSILFVSDGRTGWLYVESTKTYSQIDVAGSSRPAAANKHEQARDLFSAYSAGAGLSFDILQLGIANRVKKAEILGEEGVELEGKQVPCYVLRVEYEQSAEEAKALPTIRTYWIDKSRFIVLREDWESYGDSESHAGGEPMNMKYSTTLTKARLNESVPDEMFVFTPSPGATQGKAPQVRGPGRTTSPH